MLDIVNILNWILPFAYLLTVLAYFSDFKNKTDLLNNAKRIFLFITIGTHLFYLTARTVEFNHLPITNKNEINRK